MTERELTEVERVLFVIGDAITRTRRATATLRREGAEPHVVDALDQSATGLVTVHRTLAQGTYYAVREAGPRADDHRSLQSPG